MGVLDRTLRRAVILLASLLFAACTVTGQTFNAGGLDRIVVGRTTFAQAAEYLGALPDDTWRQGDTVLARWGYKGSIATDAVYFRQEVWLRFGPDGTFQRMENAINIPGTFRPRTQAQADQAAAMSAGPVAGKGTGTTAGGSDTPAVPDALDTTALPQAVDTPQPLLPVGTTYTPGVSYPIGRSNS
uniref:hypothetical protein n=1 Tax=Castellaniella defragrans TaxID=75697 RepID=UPI003342D2AB